MEHQKILSLLNEVNDSIFVTRKWNIVTDNSKANCHVGNEINCNTEVLKSNIYDYNDAYILVRGDITATEDPETQVAFKNWAQFTKCITDIYETTIDNAEYLDLVMSMYNLIEYSSNYSETTGSLWFYSKDEATDFNAVIGNDNSFKSFEYKTKLLGNTVAQPNSNDASGILKNAAIAVPLKYLSNFQILRETPLINCKVELKLR